jgi:hypothetical protein
MADNEVAVFGLVENFQSTDGCLMLPVDVLGKDYVVLACGSFQFPTSSFMVVATDDGTTVTLVPRSSVGSHPAGVAYTVTMNRGQVYGFTNTDSAFFWDQTGTIIRADKPIAVYGGNRQTFIPPADQWADRVFEQMTPTSAWGCHFLTMPLATRANGDTFRFVGMVNGTHVTLNGSPLTTLSGTKYETIIDGPAEIVSDYPIAVVQYANSFSYDNVTDGDPFEMLDLLSREGREGEGDRGGQDGLNARGITAGRRGPVRARPQ